MKKFLWALFVLFLVTGCTWDANSDDDKQYPNVDNEDQRDKDKDKDEEETLSITPYFLEKLPAEGHIIEFSITSDNGKWDYSLENGEWLSEISRSTTSLILEAATNVSFGEREASLLFVNTSSSTLHLLQITQLGLVVKAEADILDIMFMDDGTAKDISEMGNSVTTFPGAAMSTFYHDTYKRYVARFNHTPGGTASFGYFSVDYDAN